MQSAVLWGIVILSVRNRDFYIQCCVQSGCPIRADHYRYYRQQQGQRRDREPDGEIIGIITQSFANEDTQNLITGLSVSDSRELIRTLSGNQDIIYMGVTGTNITAEISEKKGIPKGVFVEEVEVDSPAMQVGIQNGDVIIEINGGELWKQ